MKKIKLLKFNGLYLAGFTPETIVAFEMIENKLNELIDSINTLKQPSQKEKIC